MNVISKHYLVGDVIFPLVPITGSCPSGIPLMILKNCDAKFRKLLANLLNMFLSKSGTLLISKCFQVDKIAGAASSYIIQ